MVTRRRVFITSDWHLGGTADAPLQLGSQICRSAATLADFINWVRDEADGKDKWPVELIVNGDVIDFLAPDRGYDPQVWLGDEAAASARLQKIVLASPAPFEALRKLLSHPRCSLTLLIGNHDIELSLPAVRRYLRETVLQSDGRGLEFLFDGEACVRGRLLVEHGNRYDPLNAVDFSRLRQERSHLSRGLRLREEERDELFFHSPYGSHLVVHAFNQLLPQSPFLNLLKPESSAALPLILALHPQWLPLLREAHRLFKIPAVRVANRLRRPAQPEVEGLLAPNFERESYDSFDDYLRDVVGEPAELFLSTQPPDSEGLLTTTGGSFSERYASLRARMTAAAKSTSAGIRECLRNAHAWGDAHRRRFARHALKRVQDNDLFSLDKEESPYVAAAQQMCSEGRFDAVVFGHTHFPKDVELNGGSRYLNSGTWADVIRLPAAIGSDGPEAEAALNEFLSAMAGGKIESYLFRRLTFVEARVAENGAVQTYLRQWDSSSATPRPAVEEARGQ